MEYVRRWWKPVLAGVIAVFGLLSFAGQTVSLVEARAELAGLRAHGTRAAGEARVMTHCSGRGRSYGCGTSAVWLDFTDARHQPELVTEKPVADHVYVPSGKPDADLRVATTVVYDPRDPDGAQSAGALDQSVLDLARHNVSSLLIALLMGVIGAGIAFGTLPERRRPV